MPSPFSHRFHLAAALAVTALSLAFRVSAPAQTATLTTLHRFGGTSGYYPSSALIVGTDGNFYGTTSKGGVYNNGTVYQLTPAGVMTVLHSFTYAEGTLPGNALVQSADGNFYGTTTSGGANNSGTIFKLTPAGDLTVLHNANDTVYGDGSGVGALTGGTDGNLYGIAANSDTNSRSDFFRVTPQGAFTILHHFTSTDEDDAPSALVLGNDGNFYGAASSELVKITPAGVLTVIPLSTSDGSVGLNGIVKGSDGNFYGASTYGGANNAGVVFRCTPTGKLTALASLPNTGVISFIPTLAQGGDGNFYGVLPFYGTVAGDLTNAFGAVYQVTPAGKLTILHAFNYADGSLPQTALVSGPDGKVYGTTQTGGSNQRYGTVYSVTTAGAFASVYSFGGPDGSLPNAGFAKSGDGTLYGATAQGGAYGGGILFAVVPTGGLTLVHSFSTAPDNVGANPVGNLIFGSDSLLHGIAGTGGQYGGGKIFQATTAGTVTGLFDLIPGEGPSDTESGSIIQGSSGEFYVTASYGQPTSGGGRILHYAPGGAVSVLNSFIYASDPAGPVAEGRDGNFYGTTTYGGTGDIGYEGTVYKFTPGGAITILHAFVTTDGKYPTGGLVTGADGDFYGTTSGGGAHGGGTVFKITAAGKLTTLHDFTAAVDGSGPGALLLGGDGNFYGTTSFGGANNLGTIFSMTPAGALTVLHSFSGADGANPTGPLTEGADGNFYGVTEEISRGYGTLFQLNLHGVLSFDPSGYTVNESAGSVTLTVVRTGSAAGAVSVNYSTVDGTAIAGTDYTTQIGSLSWADGDTTSRTIVVPITDRLLSGGSTLGFSVVLSQPTGGGAVGGTAGVTIVDNDPPVVNVASSGDGKAQYGVEKGKVVFRRTGDTGTALTIFYKVKGTAEAGVDYKMLTGQLVIPAGSAQAKIKIKPLDNPDNPGKLKAKVVLLPPGDSSYNVGDSRLAKIVVLGAEK